MVRRWRRCRRNRELGGEKERDVYLGEEEREENSMVQVFASKELRKSGNSLPECSPVAGYGGGGWHMLNCKEKFVHDMRKVRKET